MDVYPYAKNHLHTSNLRNIILRHLKITVLTLGIPWENLDKKRDSLGLLRMYIHMQKKKSELNGPPTYKHNIVGPQT